MLIIALKWNDNPGASYHFKYEDSNFLIKEH